MASTKKSHSFSISAAITYGWNVALKNLWFFVVLLLMILATNIVPSILASIIDNGRATLFGFLVKLIGWIIQIAISMGAIGIALRLYDKKKAEYKNLLDYTHLIIPYFLASILYTLIVLVGLILFIIPGVIWSLKFRFYSYFIVDRGMGPIEALRASSKITRGNKWNLFFLGIILGLIDIVGALALLIGLFVTMPLSMMAEAYVFRKLSAKK